MKILCAPIGLALLVPLFAACGGADEFDPGETGESTSFVSTVDHCATGLDPNAISPELTDVGDQYAYTRSATYPTSVCPPNERRTTTIVDFKVPGYPQHQIPETYSFFVQANYGTIRSTGFGDFATKLTQCYGLSMAARLQKWDSAAGNWVQIIYEEPTPEWIWDNQAAFQGHCHVPMFEYYRENYLNAYNVETGTYRLRAFAKHADGSLATVTLTSAHTGIY